MTKPIPVDQKYVFQKEVIPVSHSSDFRRGDPPSEVLNYPKIANNALCLDRDYVLQQAIISMVRKHITAFVNFFASSIC